MEGPKEEEDFVSIVASPSNLSLSGLKILGQNSYSRRRGPVPWGNRARTSPAILPGQEMAPNKKRILLIKKRYNTTGLDYIIRSPVCQPDCCTEFNLDTRMSQRGIHLANEHHPHHLTGRDPGTSRILPARALE